jgi:threonine dehydrogenase-like Zn-dependent dehydrogenase
MDKFPAVSWMNRSITRRTGRGHVQRYTRALINRIERGDIDPSFVVTHRLPLDQALQGYETFKYKEDNCVKVVLSP